MDRENDIFEQPSKIQNMNFIFDEDEDAAGGRSSQPERRPAGSAQKKRPASSGGAQRSSSQQRQRSPQSGRGQSRPVRQVSDSDRVQPKRPAASQPRQVRPEDARQPKQARPQTAQPRTAQSSEAQARPARSTQPSEAQARPVRSAQPSEAQPRQPRSAQPSEVQARPVRSAQEGGQQRSVRSEASQQRSSASRSGSANGRSRYEDSRRVNRSSATSSRSNGRRRKKRSSGFKKFLIIYVAFLVLVLIVGGIIFGSFLKKLEASQPSNIASEVAKNLTADKAASYLTSNKELLNSFGDPTEMIDAFAAGMEGKEQLSYIENKDYRADSPSYNITADGVTVAKVTLEKAGSGSFGLSNWKLASIDVAEYMDTQSYEILAPVGTTITVNSEELNEKYLTGEEAIPEFLQIASKYVQIPSYLTYKVAGITGNPEITAKDPAGKEVVFTKTENKFVAGAATTQEFISSVDPLVNEALQAWGRHFINMGGNLSAYMIDGSEWYTYIFGGPDMDPIMTSFYEYESIANYEFTEKSVSNYIKYTDDCFTVDVHYKMRIDFTTDQMSDNNQQLDATWVFVTQNDGRDWYIVDCIYK